MGYNFPDNPYVGQSFAPVDGPIWQWDGQVWKARKTAPASGVFLSGHGFGGLGKAGEGPSAISEATIGDTLPALGDWNGQLWWESDTGRFFIWFDDGTSSQWVQIIAPIVINEASGTLVTATGGITPRALADWFAGLGRAEDPPELGFWTDRGPANIWRFRDRILLGTGCTYDGRMTATSGSWLGEPEVISGDGNANQHWLERSAQLYSGSTKGGIALLGSTRSKDKAGEETSLSTIAVAGYAYADIGTFSNGDVRGGYFEGVRGSVSMSRVLGLDVNVKNLSGNLIGNPYNLEIPGSTYGIRLAAGGDLILAPEAVNNSTAALIISKNARRWNTGIIFSSEAVEGTDVNGEGKAIAIEMSRGQAIKWRHGSATNATSGEIRSDNDDLNNETRIIFEKTGLMFRCMDTTQTVELPIAEFPANGGASAYPSIQSGAAQIVIEALGQSPDADIRFVPKGAGQVTTATSVIACNAMPIPPGGTSGAGFMVSATSNFGLFFGSDQPTLPAAPGSLYVRSDGTTNKRTYVNTGSGWISLLEDVSDKVDIDHIGSGGDAHAAVIPVGDPEIPDGVNGFMTATDKARFDGLVDVTPNGPSGLMPGADKAKLDGIVDVTPGGPSGLMPGADKTKLDGIIPVVPDGAPGLITGTDKTKLDSLSVLAPVTPNGPPGLMLGTDKTRLDSFTDVVAGGASGFMTGLDKTKLDGIIDVTPNGPSGLMRGADKTKLDGILDVIAGGVSGLITGADKTRLDSFADVTPDGASGFMLGSDKTKLDNIDTVSPGGIPGLMDGADKTKLDGLPDTLGDAAGTGDSGLMTSADKAKLDAIAPVIPEGIPGLITGEDKTKLDAMVVGTGGFIDRIYATVGVQNWNTGPGIVALDVWVQAGGGGGGGATAIVGESAHGSGGGGGGYGYRSYTAAEIASMGSAVVVVGAGGLGGAASNGMGGTGGISSFGALSCSGGLGGIALGSGTAMAMVPGGDGGLTTSGAQFPIHGSSGQFAVRIGTPASAGGGGGGIAGGGCGGPPPSMTAGAIGNAGSSGAGGSGAFSYNGTGGGAGGAGGIGWVKVREYY